MLCRNSGLQNFFSRIVTIHAESSSDYKYSSEVQEEPILQKWLLQSGHSEPPDSETEKLLSSSPSRKSALKICKNRVSLSSERRGAESTAIQIGGILQYKLEVYCNTFWEVAVVGISDILLINYPAPN